MFVVGTKPHICVFFAAVVWTLSTWTKLRELITHPRRAWPWTCRPITTPTCHLYPIPWLLLLTRLLSSSRQRIISSLCCKTPTDSRPEKNTFFRYFPFQWCVHVAYVVRVFLFVWCCFGDIPWDSFCAWWAELNTPLEGWNNWGVYVTQDWCSSESGLCMASATIHGAKHGVRKSLLSSHLFSWLTVSWSSQTPQVNTQEELFTNAGPSEDKSLSDEISIPQHNATPIFLNWPPSQNSRTSWW